MDPPHTPPPAGETPAHQGRRHVIRNVLKREVSVRRRDLQQVGRVGRNLSMLMAGRPGALGLVLFMMMMLGVAASVDVTVGSDVTLPCKYSEGRLHSCWGRGPVPNNGCDRQIVTSNGYRVLSRASERYEILGPLSRGYYSLTIRQVQESDTGTYGCRVEVSGMFNDYWVNRYLRVVPGKPHPVTMVIKDVEAKTLKVHWNVPFSAGRPITSYRVDVKERNAPWDTAVRTEVYDPALTQLTLVDFRPARSYNLRMFAVNVVGTSDESNTLSVTTKQSEPDGPPLDVQLLPLSTQSIRVTWKPPAAELMNGNLVGYKINYKQYNNVTRRSGRRQEKFVPKNLPRNVTLTQLKPSTMYIVGVQAGTSVGFGLESPFQICSTFDEPPVTKPTPEEESSSTMTTPVYSTASTASWDTATTLAPGRPEPPMLVLKEVDEYTICLSWSPGSQGNSSITSYILEYKAINASWDVTKIVIVIDATENTTTILENKPSTYNIRMFSKNSQGTSEASNVLNVTTGHHEEASIVSTESTNNGASMGDKDEPRTNLVAIWVPVVLVLALVAAGTGWSIFRLRRNPGHWNVRWLMSGAVHMKEVSDSDSDSEI